MAMGTLDERLSKNAVLITGKERSLSALVGIDRSVPARTSPRSMAIE